MQLNNDILNELKTISPLLADMERVNVFTVPNGYFNALSSNLSDLIEFGEDSQKTAKVLNPFTVPAGYFESLSQNIMTAINDVDTSWEKEIKELSPALAGLNHENPFTIPANYFENLPGQILNKIPMQAKVVSMRRPAIYRYAVAAVITGIMGLSLFTIFDNKASNDNTPKYSAEVMDQASHIVKSNSFDKELETLSGKEIEQYLRQSGQNVEAALVASVTDDANLPSQEDYLYNENTLDELLKNIN